MINELNGQTNACARLANQCVEVSAPLVLSPTAVLGNITTTCQGNPTVECITNEDQTLSQVRLRQKICLTIPVRYGVSIAAETPRIACSEEQDGTCHCGC